MAPQRSHVLALALWVAAAVAVAQSPAPSPAAGHVSELFSLKKRHLVVMSAAAQRLARVGERRQRGETIQWDRLAGWLASVARLDRELALREALLKVPPGGPFVQRLDQVRALLQARVARLQPFASAKLLADGAFDAPEVPAQPASPTTAAEARTRLRAQPTGSIHNLFGATAGIQQQALPGKIGN